MRCSERMGAHYGRHGESFCDHPNIRDEEAGRIFVDSGILKDMRGEQYGFYEIPLSKISEPNVAFKMRKIKTKKRG